MCTNIKFQPHSIEEKHIFSFGFYNKILVANDICDKNPLSHLGQVACDINCKWQGILDEQKSQQIQVHPLTPLYMYCHMRLRCDYFDHYWRQMMCYHVSQYLII